MKISIFSSNTKICQKLASNFSETTHPVETFSTLSALNEALEKQSLVYLIYHLGLRKDDETEFVKVQSKYKEILNTLVLTNTPHPEQGVRLLNKNIRGYANTYLEHDKLLMALTIIEQGEVWAGDSLIQYLLSNSRINQQADDLSEPDNTLFHQLTIREREIAEKILTGLQNKLIANELNITERTVKAHLSTIFKKLAVRNRLELTIKLQNANRRSINH